MHEHVLPGNRIKHQVLPPSDQEMWNWQGAYCRCLAVTDRYTGAILPLGTGLLTVFLNREVTVLLGLMSYSLPWEIIWD